ncbi:MAG: hypothetical protein AAGN35_27630 [Bacteroidota bacterium]
MMMRFFLFRDPAKTLGTLLLGMGLLFTACKNQSPNGGTRSGGGLQPEDVIGPWQARQIEVKLVSKDNGSRDSSYILDAAVQAAKMGQRPVLTIIRRDGEYREETRSVGDSLLREANGYWHLFSDTLVFRLRGENAAEIRYHAARKGNQLWLQSRGDFDGDAFRDDHWTVKLQKR